MLHRFLLWFAGPSFCQHKHGDGMGHRISHAIAPRPGDRVQFDWHSLLHPPETCSALLITHLPDFFTAHKKQNFLFSHARGDLMTTDDKEDCNEYFFLSFLQESNIAEIPR